MEKQVSDNLRPPGNPGGTRGKSESQKNQAPLESGNAGSSTSTGCGGIATPVTPGKTSGNRNKVH